MNRGTGSPARVWAALAATACALVVMVAPSLLLTAAAESTPLTLALMTVALAALVRVDLRSVALAGAGDRGTTRATGDGDSLVLTDRVTDPVHHPLRPRAPGTA
jgi:hypothetical protein